MKNIVLNVTKEYECDTLVCGGGVGGFSAAVSSARSGADTILIESGGFLGGTATKCLVGPFMTCYDAKGEDRIIKGLYSVLEDRLVARGGAVAAKDCPGGDSHSGYRTPGRIGVMPFNTEDLKITMEHMCLEYGVKLIYHTTLIACDTENGRITCAYAADGNDIIAIKAKSFVDATGSSSLAYKAGAETVRGNDDGTVQTASMFFVITGVDKEVLDAYMADHTDMRSRFFMDIIEQGQNDGSFPCGTQKLRIFENPNGTWTVNMAQIDGQLNELDSEAVTNAEIAQREQILKILDFLKNRIVGLENIKLLYTASDIGIRESRRIVGKTVFCLDDIKSSRKFDDRIAVCANSIDIHQKKGVSYSAHNNANYYIPLSCLISKNISNLLVAGKNLSADRYAHAAVRVMPPCIAMGEAAGITAALAAINGTDARNVDYREVQRILVENGARID
jgi:hypothetical protein